MSSISLIVSVYNRSYLLRKSLLSLVNQTVQPDELILTDDGSEEDVVAAVSDIVSKFDFPVKYVKQKNKGFRLAKVRNNGVRYSSGDFLIFLDQDLIYTKDLLKTFIQYKKEKRFLTGMPIWLDEAKSKTVSEESIIKDDFLKFIGPEEKKYINKQYNKDKKYYYLHKIGLLNKPHLRGGFCAINKKDFETINGYDENFIGWGSEDDDLGRRLYAIGCEGLNPFNKEFAIHLYHPKAVIPNKGVKEQANYNYYKQKQSLIKKGHVKAEVGLANSNEEDGLTITQLN